MRCARRDFIGPKDDAQMSIQCAFFGTLSRDAERRERNGKPYLQMNVRVVDGNKTIWISVTSYDQQALECAEYYVANAPIYVQGKFEANEWIDPKGRTHIGYTCLSLHSRLAFPPMRNQPNG